MIDALATPALEYVAGISLVLALFLMAALRYEAGVPLFLSVLFVPPIIVVGFGIAVAAHVWLSVPMLHASGLLAAALFALLVGYEALASAGAPKAGRHRF